MDLRETLKIAADAKAAYQQIDFHSAPLAYEFEKAAWNLDLPALLAALDELDALKAENERLVAERDEARADATFGAPVVRAAYADLEAELAALRTEVEALRAENAALKIEMDDYREAYRKTIEDECVTDEKHCACVPFLRSEIKRISDECDEGRCPSAEHERLAAAELRAKAERLHKCFRNCTIINGVPDQVCEECGEAWPFALELGEEKHAPDCPAAPGFLDAKEGA